MRMGLNHINKPDFLTAYLSAYNKAIGVNTVCNRFAAIGLVPFDLERVLVKLNTQLRTPTPLTDLSTSPQGP